MNLRVKDEFALLLVDVYVVFKIREKKRKWFL